MTYYFFVVADIWKLLNFQPRYNGFEDEANWMQYGSDYFQFSTIQVCVVLKPRLLSSALCAQIGFNWLNSRCCWPTISGFLKYLSGSWTCELSSKMIRPLSPALLLFLLFHLSNQLPVNASSQPSGKTNIFLLKCFTIF